MDILTDKLRRLEEIFPDCITEKQNSDGEIVKAFDFDKLKEIFSDDTDAPERYQFDWVGKKFAAKFAHTSIDKTLRPCPAESLNWDTTQNLYIEGENLEVLKILQKSYFRKVKMIYIDPPYNTGKDFIYRDNFQMDEDEYNAQIELFDDEDNKNFTENLSTNPRVHSDWCSMIYARLLLARNLLTDDGVIFISIDDNEQANLKKICDEVFGERNFVAELIWRKKYTGGKGTKTFIDYHEYILVYAKTIEKIGDIKMMRPESERNKFTQIDEYFNERGKYYTRPLKSNLDPRPTLVYPIELPNGKTVTTQWICAKKTYEELLRDGRIEFKDAATSKYPVYKKFYENDDGGNVKMPSFLEVASNNDAKEELKELFQIEQTRDLPFQTPKPTKLLDMFIKNFSSDNDIILDFFAGSSSTAHSVIKCNAEDGGHRKFIMVQLPEVCNENSEAYKAGYKNICEIGKERIRRAGQKINAELFKVDVGFRVLKSDTTNFRDVYFYPEEMTQEKLIDCVENIKSDRNDLDLLFDCLLKWGIELTLPYCVEKFEDVTIHRYGDEIIACFDENISRQVIEYIAKKKVARVIFRDSCFTRDDEKMNARTIFNFYSPNTKYEVI